MLPALEFRAPEAANANLRLVSIGCEFPVSGGLVVGDRECFVIGLTVDYGVTVLASSFSIRVLKKKDS